MARMPKKPVDAHVGARVRLRRMLLGVSQTELGERLGVTFQQIQKYENGGNRISASALHKISQVLQVPVGHFFEELGPVKLPGSTSRDAGVLAFVRSPEGLELNRAFAAIENARTRKRVLRLIEAIAADL